MAYLRFKGFDEEFLREQQSLFVSEFSRTAKVSQETVQVELLGIKPITDTPRSLEISMFQRDQRTHDGIARTLHELLSHFGYPDVHIYFILLTPSLYYEDGAPLEKVTGAPERTRRDVC